MSNSTRVSSPVVTKDLSAGKRWRQVKSMSTFYLLLLPAVGLLIIFHYVPIWGIAMAFTEFSYGKGILGSPWNDFAHFKMLFNDPFFLRVFRNSIIIRFYHIVFGFPMPILLALLVNELRSVAFKKTFQTISYLPHFVSWVVLGTIVTQLFHPSRGIVASVFDFLGMEAINFLTYSPTFRGLLVVTAIWQGVGWTAIIYMAALSSIDTYLYESAAIDGANRIQQAIYITIPSLVPVITILFILNLGQMLDAGFDQIFNLYNPMVYERADVIDTYVYRRGIMMAQFAYSAAVGLFKNVVGVTLVVLSNTIIRRFTEYGLW